jgi:hypothetical protein
MEKIINQLLAKGYEVRIIPPAVPLIVAIDPITGSEYVVDQTDALGSGEGADLPVLFRQPGRLNVQSSTRSKSEQRKSVERAKDTEKTSKNTGLVIDERNSEKPEINRKTGNTYKMSAQTRQKMRAAQQKHIAEMTPAQRAAFSLKISQSVKSYHKNKRAAARRALKLAAQSV